MAVVTLSGGHRHRPTQGLERHRRPVDGDDSRVLQPNLTVNTLPCQSRLRILTPGSCPRDSVTVKPVPIAVELACG